VTTTTITPTPSNNRKILRGCFTFYNYFSIFVVCRCGNSATAPKLFLDPNLPVTFFWEECNPYSVYMNPMRTDDMDAVWKNVKEAAHDPCAHNFQLREFLDLLDQLQKEQEEELHPKPLNSKS
jgi:hypothetical protein